MEPPAVAGGGSRAPAAALFPECLRFRGTRSGHAAISDPPATSTPAIAKAAFAGEPNLAAGSVESLEGESQCCC
jgi:hypothetical protein